MRLSIVIPVFRVEDTINRCVESVVNQDYDNIEVILVDDGSPDKCPAICDSWASRDSRVRVIHKQNGGLSDARNAGIAIASGDYITFVDSDDYLDEQLYATLMSTIISNPSIDILEYGVRYIGKGNDQLLTLSDKTYHDSVCYWTQGMAYKHSYACNKIYKTSLFDEITYPVGKVFEDMWTLPLLTSKAHVIVTTSAGYYNYQWNPSGITATATGMQLRMLLEAHLRFMDIYPMITDDRYYMSVLNIQLDVVELTGDTPILPKRKIISIRNLTLPNKIKALALNILGLNNLCQLNKIIHKLCR